MRTRILCAVLLAFAATGCGNLNDNLGTAIYVRYTPDGHLVVFAGDRIDVYSADLDQVEARIPAPAPSDAIWPYTGVFSLSDDGTTAVVVHPNRTHNYAELYSLSTLTKRLLDLGPLPQDPDPHVLNNDQPDDVALSPQGNLLFVMGGIHSVTSLMQMFDTTTGQNLWSIDWAITPVFSPDESRMYAMGGHWDTSTLQGFDTQTGAITLDVTPASRLGRLGLMPDASTVIALTTAQPAPCTPNNICPPRITSYATADGSVTRQFALAANTYALEYQPNGLPLFRCSTAAGLCAVGLLIYDPVSYYGPIGSSVQVWSTDGTLVQSIDTAFNDAAVSPDGQFVAVALGSNDSSGNALVYRVSDGSLVRTLHYGGGPF
jgi:DNA-binding beta-propeller fold protein YncE